MSTVITLSTLSTADRAELVRYLAGAMGRTGRFQHSAAGAVAATLRDAIAGVGATVDLTAALAALNRTDLSSLVRVLESLDQIAPTAGAQGGFIKAAAAQIAASDASPSTLRHA